jgi:hypothetical protein
MNDCRHAALLNASNCIPLHLALLHMAEILKISHVTSGKLRRMSGISNGEEVRL